MVGKQRLSGKKSQGLNLEELVPRDNFYRRLKQILDLTFLYPAVAPYYGPCGQQSIDPTVFFKLLLVGHRENLLSDRAIIRCSQLRLDILYFLDYPLGQPLPWHSTLSRTRQRLPASIFESLFERVLSQCAQAGMVGGDTQAIDSAYVEANASLDRLKPLALGQSSLDKNDDLPLNSLEVAQPTLQSFPEFKVVANPKRRDRNNRTHRHPLEPQARLAQKAGKPCRLYYLSSMAVDTAHHVITHIQADYADEKDSRHLLEIVDKTTHTLKRVGFPPQCILADGGFSSGENYACLEDRGLQAYVRLYGRYKPVRAPFTYDAEQDVYRCGKGAVLPNHGIRMSGGYGHYYYIAKVTDCQNCPLKISCCGKRARKKLVVTMYRNHYQRMKHRLESYQGKRMKRLRSATVEPVFGSLLNYYGMRRSNARGKAAAHKNMVLAAIVYNLQKYLAFGGGPKAKARALTKRVRNFFIHPAQAW